MVIGSFCYNSGNIIKTIQPKCLKVKGFQKGFIQGLNIYQSIIVEEDLNRVSYVFPTDNNLCIYGITFQIGDEIIKTQLRSKEQAKEIFNEGRKLGRTTMMTEQTSQGMTKIQIGNILKNKVVAVFIDCALTSTLQNPNTIITKIPLQLSEPNGEIIDLFDLPSLDIDVDIEISQIEKIEKVSTNCESKYEKIDEYNGKLTINKAFFNDENLLIMTRFYEPVKSQMLQSDRATAISFIPEFQLVNNERKEFVFLVDCSASMIGESIQKAKESLHLFLSKIPEGSFFNIICFGSTFKKLFERSSEKVENTIEKASTFIDNIKANLGGTQMLQMLNDVFENDVKAGSQRQVFIVTDGEVYNRKKVVKKVEDNKNFNRIFTIGLGPGADAGFLNEIAEITNGKYDYVFNKSELPLKVSEQLELSLSEAANDIQLHIEGNESFGISPYPITPILPGVVYHIFLASSLPIGEVMFTGKNKNNEFENIISQKLKITEKASVIFALFAQKQLKMIKDDVNKSISLSISSGVQCEFTSYVAVSQIQYREVIPDEVDHNENDKNDEQDDDENYNKEMSFLDIIKNGRFLLRNVQREPTPAPIQKIIYDSNRCHEEHPKIWSDDAPFVDIIKLQSKDGFWDLPTDFISKKFSGKDLLIDVDFSHSPILKKRVISTVFTLAFLAKFHFSDEKKWQYSKEKGFSWLKRIDFEEKWDEIVNKIIPDISN
ncbi:von Willebrand factor A domain-containing protein 5A [Tritrichomonas musculus]|uniref:von Willebrand factor A domain-containing protein 5A n=1 Tax=Tritrichomonas musculus TaxID=1915356 RepID=A0ABR2GV04_9EUKA